MQTTFNEDDCPAIVPISKRTVDQNVDHSPIKFTKRMGKTANSDKIMISYHSKMQGLERNMQVSVSPSSDASEAQERMWETESSANTQCAVYAPTHEIVKAV